MLGPIFRYEGPFDTKLGHAKERDIIAPQHAVKVRDAIIIQQF